MSEGILDARHHIGRVLEPDAAYADGLRNLKESQEQADWLEAVHRKTHIAKSVLVRLALAMFAERNGHPPFPSSQDDQ